MVPLQDLGASCCIERLFDDDVPGGERAMQPNS
jgi:hypothetical protein